MAAEIKIIADGGNWTGPPLVSGGTGDGGMMEEARGEQNTVEESTPIIMNMGDIDDTKEYDEEAVSIPESTHSFLFTEPIGSVPFMFSFGITGISITCLVLALINNIKDWSVPANVTIEVKIAQFMSILIALLMEEEIPTGLYLLRRISQPHLKSQCPQVSYWRFAGSCVLRITMGYLFLANVIVILILADDVIAIFYDVLALQFIQQLDDIGFSLSKMDVLGKRMQRATLTPFFHVEFQKQKESLGLKWRYRIALKGAYFLNLAFFVAVMVIVFVRQSTGYYQSTSITVLFDDAVWDGAIVNHQEDHRERILLYSWFNGVYVKDKDRTHQGRPIYVEQNKADHTPFDEAGPIDPYWGLEQPAVVPATIMYCNGRWIFTHEEITKSSRDEGSEAKCNWLARSEETAGFDLLDVSSSWQLWVGAIQQTDVTVTDNECQDDDDCNLNGVCNKSTGECECFQEEGVTYFGIHCEVKVKDQCRVIVDEIDGSEWSIDAWTHNVDVFESYSRPAFIATKQNHSDAQDDDEDDIALVYSGTRWFKVFMAGSRDEALTEVWDWQVINYHAFWTEALQPGSTLAVSDVTTLATPVGPAFYSVGKFGSQFVPFGIELTPYKNVTGRGVYRCKEDLCTFCPDGLSVEEDFVIPGAPDNTTCGELRDYVDYHISINTVLDGCEDIQLAEQICCPVIAEQELEMNIDNALAVVVNSSASIGSCSFCPSGLGVEAGTVIPEGDGSTCGDVNGFSKTLEESSEMCQSIKLAEPFCCGP